MKTIKIQSAIWCFVASLALCATGVRAQNQQNPKNDPAPVNPDSSIFPAGSSAGTSGFGGDPAPPARGISPEFDPLPDSVPVQPDTHTLSGAEFFGIGSLEHSHTLFDPSIRVTQLGGTGMVDLSGQASLTSLTLFGGSISLDQVGSISRLVAFYNGGGVVSIPDTNYNPTMMYHEFSLAEEITWDRWRLRLRNDLLASPNAAFGGQGMGGPGLVGQSSSALVGNVVSNAIPAGETIQTGSAMRLNDTAIAQVDYAFSRQSTISFIGSYGLLHFIHPGYIDSHSVGAQVGFDHKIDPKNSVALIAGYSGIGFSGYQYAVDSYFAQLAYGRKITGRLGLQAAGGPARVLYRNTGSGNSQLWSWAANAALSYTRLRNSYALSYSHGQTTGSGVLLGTMSQTVSASVQRNFTRHWLGTVNVGYSSNIGQVVASSAPNTFSTWFSGASIVRQITPRLNVGFNYGIQQQINGFVCPVENCGATGKQQTFGMTVNWGIRPIG